MNLKEKIAKAINYTEGGNSLPLSKQLVRKLSKDKECFVFDKKIGNVVIDGFFEDSYKKTFVIAKCEEPYVEKEYKVTPFNQSLYSFISENMPCELTTTVSKNTTVECFAYDEKIYRFDLLDLIETLVGIAAEALDSPLENKQIDLIYLLFDPTELDISQEDKEEIEAIYERLCYEANLIDFAALMRTIFTFLKQENGYTVSDEDIDEIVFKSTFTLATHEFYPILLGIDR